MKIRRTIIINLIIFVGLFILFVIGYHMGIMGQETNGDFDPNTLCWIFVGLFLLSGLALIVNIIRGIAGIPKWLQDRQNQKRLKLLYPTLSFEEAQKREAQEREAAMEQWQRECLNQKWPTRSEQEARERDEFISNVNFLAGIHNRRYSNDYTIDTYKSLKSMMLDKETVLAASECSSLKNLFTLLVITDKSIYYCEGSSLKKAFPLNRIFNVEFIGNRLTFNDGIKEYEIGVRNIDGIDDMSKAIRSRQS